MRLLEVYLRGTGVVTIPSPPVASFGSKTYLAINTVPNYGYSSQEPGPIDVASAGFAEKTDNSGNPPSVSSNGWPAEDFILRIMYGDPSESGPIQYTCTFTGKATVAFGPTSQQGSSLSAVSYNSGTNTSTFTFNFTKAGGNLGPQLKLTATQKTAASATNTGVDNFSIKKTSQLGNSNLFDSALATYYADFPILRTMDAQGTNNNSATTTWATRNAIFPRWQSTSWIENLVAMANQFSKDLWMCIPANATADWDNNFFAYIRDNLVGKCYFEFGNETWNVGFTLTHQLFHTAVAEAKGAIGQDNNGPRTLISVTGNGTTTTAQLGYTCDLTVGQHVKLASGSGAPSEWTGFQTVTVTAVSGTTFSYASGFSGTFTFGTNAWFVCTEAITTLYSGAGGTFDASQGDDNAYGLQARYCMRRIVQASDRCRAVVGDSAMMTKFFPLWMNQGVSGNGAGDLATIARFAGRAANVKNKIFAFGGAPYWETDATSGGGPDLSGDTASHTVADYVAAYAQSGSGAKGRFFTAQRAVQALKYGIKQMWYEGGPANESGPSRIGDANTYNANAARYDPAMASIYRQFLEDAGKVGVFAYAHYHGGYTPLVTNSGNSYGFTDSINTVRSPWQGMKDYNALAANPAFNPVDLAVSGTVAIDGRLIAGNFVAAGGYSGLRSNNNSQDYLVTVKTAGTYTLVINYSAPFTFGTAWSIQVNGVQQASFTPSTTADLTTYRDSPSLTLTLGAGINAISIAGSGGGGADNEKFHTLTFTRTA